MRTSVVAWLLLSLLGVAGDSALWAQEAPSAPETSPKESAKEPIPFRAIEGPVIINLPSVAVPQEGTLTLLITHRFVEPLEDSSINDFFSLDQGSDWGFGLSYTPIKNLEASFYRASAPSLGDYEAAARYRFPLSGPFGVALRAGGNWRIKRASPVYDHTDFFAQAILAFSLGERARFTVVPTYLSQTSQVTQTLPSIDNTPTPPPPHDQSCIPPPPGGESYVCSGNYKKIFNVPVAVSVAITHSITVHGEIFPSYHHADSAGVGWNVSLEKTVLRHRFALVAGNQRLTTVDQYTAPLMPLTLCSTCSTKSIYLGFNLIRQWKLN
jgi:Membrane bound beta barrel domain (DUF5777)